MLGLSACGSVEERLQGERLTVDGVPVKGPDKVTIVVPRLDLPAPVTNDVWLGTGTEHAALNATVALKWSANVAIPPGRRHLITAPPIFASGRLFVLGAQSDITGLSSSGQILWQRDLTPNGENAADASGGALSYGNGVLYASTGFGQIVALNPENGNTLWRHDTYSSGVSAVTVSGGIAYATTIDGSALALDPGNGRILWEINGTESLAHFAGMTPPAVSSEFAIFPFSSGEILSTFRRGGLRNWVAVVTGNRVGEAVASVNDVHTRPIIQGGRLYMGNTAGRVMALSMDTGERIWTTLEGVSGNMVLSGGSLFFVN
ncbi:MAG: PQQ-binding-like beta-propeller repeat protein, partial [Pseudomonadota bacterium]